MCPFFLGKRDGQKLGAGRPGLGLGSELVVAMVNGRTRLVRGNLNAIAAAEAV